MDKSTFTLILKNLNDIKERQESSEDKLDNLKEILLEYCDRTERLEIKITESIMIPKFMVKIGAILAGIPAFIACIVALFKDI